MIYFIGDLHLFCRNQTNEGICNHDRRPFDTVEEMNETILRKWNAKVNNGDTVVIHGDVSMRGKNDALIGLVSQLKGKKILLAGNHDQLTDYRYTKLYEQVRDYLELDISFGGKAYKVACSHYPYLLWSGQHRGTIFLYAHAHNSIEHTFYQDCIRRLNESEELSLRRKGGQKIRAINVGAMMPYVDYEPRSLQELLEATQPDLFERED